MPPKTVQKPSQSIPKHSPSDPRHVQKIPKKPQKNVKNRTCADRESNPRPPGWDAAGPTIGLIPRWRSGPKLISYASKIQALTAGAAQRLIRHPKCGFGCGWGCFTKGWQLFLGLRKSPSTVKNNENARFRIHPRIQRIHRK